MYKYNAISNVVETKFNRLVTAVACGGIWMSCRVQWDSLSVQSGIPIVENCVDAIQATVKRT